MPTYKVIEPGFYGGLYYAPTGKRPYLTTDKPFTKKNPMPSWVIPMPKEDSAIKAKREMQAASRSAAKEFISERIVETEKLIDKLKKDKNIDEKELMAVEGELDNLKGIMETFTDDKSTQEQVSESSTEGAGKEAGFIDKVKNAVGLGNSDDTVETL